MHLSGSSHTESRSCNTRFLTLSNSESQQGTRRYYNGVESFSQAIRALDRTYPLKVLVFHLTGNVEAFVESLPVLDETLINPSLVDFRSLVVVLDKVLEGDVDARESVRARVRESCPRLAEKGKFVVRCT